MGTVMIKCPDTGRDIATGMVADRESFAETRRRMDMRVAVIMTVMVMRLAAMIVGHRDRLPLYRRRHREERRLAGNAEP
jgi:predicted DNA repair protein MutK